MDNEPEATWLRLRIIRLRTAFRYVLEPRVETILREVITDMEDRLERIEAMDIERSRASRKKSPPTAS
jgi:hypothetical protein